MGPPERVLAWTAALRRSPAAIDILITALIVILFAGAAILVYTTGGTKLSWPYLTLIPVLIAAARFRLVGGLLAGMAGGLLLGPYMPLDTAAGIAQETANWLIRLAFYTGLGGFAGFLFLLLRQQSEQRERAARTDADTGMPNKTALFEALEQEDRKTGPGPLLMLVRVTGLAEIIHAIGITAGDQLMRELDKRLRSHVGEPLQVYRFSASELMLVKPAPMQSAAQISQLVLRSVELPVEVQGIPVHTDIVLGTAGDTRDRPPPRELIRRARLALAEANDRKVLYCEYLPRHERESARTIELLGRVRKALEANEFELHYQPKIRPCDHSVAGCEALIRWRGEDGSLIPPGRFMPRVEQSALIDPLTRFVVDAARDFSKRVDGQTVSINFTARNLLDHDLIDRLGRIVDDHELGRDRIEIEITEGAIINDPQAARESIARLRDHGFLVSIDDFGTGYSSFGYLRMLPLTGLKIDRVFVSEVDSDDRARELMKCMIQVGHALDLEVVAEGVETGAQLQTLEELGCDLIQGFHIAGPMPEPRYLEWCRTNSDRVA